MATHNDNQTFANSPIATASADSGGASGLATSPLVVIREEPFNAETRLDEHYGIITPASAFYVRNHFSLPRLDSSQWVLRLEGAVEQMQTWRYDELLALPSRTLVVTLECAGNGRSAQTPQPPGEPWQYGAVSTAEWTGVSLANLLHQAGLRSDTVEIVAEGADEGVVDGVGDAQSFARSLPLAQALHIDTLVAYAMNSQPLTLEHGFPARLVVPGWYGMASVKWLTRLSAVTAPFHGYYQKDRYVLVSSSIDPSADKRPPIPLNTMAVRSVLIRPTPGATLPRGRHRLQGLAWSGHTPIVSVEVSSNGGVQWEPCELVGEPLPYVWRQWEYQWEATSPGRIQLCSRAFDAAGNSQPMRPAWNELGYANNAIQSVEVEIR